MTNQFSPKVSAILAFSREEAQRLYNTYIGPEHLLLALLRENVDLMNELAKQKGVKLSNIKEELETQIRQNGTEENHDTQLQNNANADATSITLNDKASNILKLAVLEARKQHKTTVDENHLLLAILHDKTDNYAKMVLEKNNIDYEDAAAIAYPEKVPQKRDSIFDIPNEDEEEDTSGSYQQPGKGSKPTQQRTQTAGNNGNGGQSRTPVVDNFGIDLTKAAEEGKLDPMVGREKEVQRVVEILGRRKKNNPVLIGEPGVGKSAIVEGLAQMIVQRKTSPVLFGKRVINLDMSGMVAGTKYRGQFEERIKALVKELEENDDIIVFIDEIHTLVGAGSPAGTMDAANMLKPALARGVIQCIGATTMDEYRNSIEKDGALERRFQKVIVEPTNEEQTELILLNLKDRYERHHHVKYDDDALKYAVKLAGRYVNDRFFPDKAIDVMDEAGSKVHLLNSSIPPEIEELEKQAAEMKKKKIDAVKAQNFELAAEYRDKQVEMENKLKDANDKWNSGEGEDYAQVTEKDIADVVATMTGIPVARIAENEGARLKALGDTLKSKIIAQDNAIDKMVKAIQRSRVGLKDPNHPIGAFMFLGPTGVGKTYLAKKLAEEMFGSADAIVRIDMSEYTESFNTSRLIGAPPGYVGYGEGGQLTEKVRRHPYSIVLLDEIEKAHGNVFNMLLQVLDEGRMTDGNGRLVDFRNTIIIMTSNAGTRTLKEFAHGVGFNSINAGGNLDEKGKEYARSIIQKSLSKTFSPEFLNRLDEIITFDQLDIEAIKKIIDIELKGTFKRIDDLGYKVRLSDEAKAFVATKGYDIQFGARPLKRAIQTYIEDGICEQILSGELHNGDTIVVDKNPEKEELTFTAEKSLPVTPDRPQLPEETPEITEPL